MMVLETLCSWDLPALVKNTCPCQLCTQFGCTSIALTAFLDYVVRGQKINKVGVAAICLSFLGVTVLANSKYFSG